MISSSNMTNKYGASTAPIDDLNDNHTPVTTCRDFSELLKDTVLTLSKNCGVCLLVANGRGLQHVLGRCPALENLCFTCFQEHNTPCAVFTELPPHVACYKCLIPDFINFRENKIHNLLSKENITFANCTNKFGRIMLFALLFLFRRRKQHGLLWTMLKSMDACIDESLTYDEYKTYMIGQKMPHIFNCVFLYCNLLHSVH